MAIGANSYGTLAGVGILVPAFSGDGAFTATTRPAKASVEGWIDEVSSLVNIMLKQEGFDIPVVQSDAVLTLQFFVQQEVAAIVEGINGFGRFGPTTKSGGKKGRFALLVEDVQNFIDVHANGFEDLGVVRLVDQADAIKYRGTDESGDDIHPIFQREAFGASFTDWDT